jgi:hypothetical protein
LQIYGSGCALKKSHITSVALIACEVMAFGMTGEPGQECPRLAGVYKITSALPRQPDQIRAVAGEDDRQGKN